MHVTVAPLRTSQVIPFPQAKEKSAVEPTSVRFASGGPQKKGKENASPTAKKAFFAGAALTNIAIGVGGLFNPLIWGLYAISLPVTGIGVYDAVQKKHALRRNYPLFARARWIAESMRPKVRQYFMEDDLNGRPLSLNQREEVYKRATLDVDTIPFGTKLDVNEVGYEFVGHSIGAIEPSKEDVRILIGGPDCKKPYSASIFNISAMSYGALSKNAILALIRGAALGKFYHNTGEGSISPYHFGKDVDIEDDKFNYDNFIEDMRKVSPEELKTMGDICWQIGTGYFGARNPDGTFNYDKFRKIATLPQVKMIEIKLSQGAKPGHGGILPGVKVTKGIAKIRGAEVGKDVISPPGHTAFKNPIEMMGFIKKLRELSDGKPIGFKLCIGNKHEFLAICKAMVETGITPDFITVDGGEGGTGAAPRELSDHVGMPINDAIVFVNNALVGTNLRDKIKVIASGKIIDGFDMVNKLGRGANVFNSARGMMLALGCIQALECNKNTCPTGVATQNKSLMKALDPNLKSVRVFNYQHQTVKSLKEILGAMGIEKPEDVKPWHVQKRVAGAEIKNLSQIYDFIPPGSLLGDAIPESFKNEWNHASPETFSSVNSGKLWKTPAPPKPTETPVAEIKPEAAKPETAPAKTPDSDSPKAA